MGCYYGQCPGANFESTGYQDGCHCMLCLSSCHRQCIITYILHSGLTLSGVVMSTIYRLLDLDYNVYVIRDNVLDLLVDQSAAVSHVMLDLLLPKMGFKAISIDEALQMLEHS